MKFEKAQQSLLGELLIRYLLFKKFKLNNSMLVFSKTKYGKPLLNSLKDFHFNISHSKDWIVCAVDNHPIGVDIEVLRDFNLKIGKRFYTNKEYNYIMNASYLDQMYRFYEIWTMKESYMKAVGKGFLLSSTSFDTLDFNNEVQIEDCKYYFSKFAFNNEVLLTVCSTKKQVEIEYINDEVLISTILNILEKEG
ncbi:MAG: 4'-phosphopantetheinyl transferase superfamily protein [Bacilli bacterium]